MLKRIQRAHYQQGLSVYDVEVLAELASEMGIENATWQQAMADAESQLLPAVNETRQLMAEHGRRCSGRRDSG